MPTASDFTVKMTSLDSKISQLTKALYQCNKIDQTRVIELMVEQYESIKNNGKGAVTDRLKGVLVHVDQVHDRVKEDLIATLEKLELFLMLQTIVNKNSVILNCKNQSCEEIHKRTDKTPRLDCFGLKVSFYKSLDTKEYGGSISKLIKTLVDYRPNFNNILQICVKGVLNHATACNMPLDDSNVVNMLMNPYCCPSLCREALVLGFSVSFLYQVFIQRLMETNDRYELCTSLLKDCDGEVSELADFHTKHFGPESANFFKTHTRDGRVNLLQPFLKSLHKNNPSTHYWTSSRTYNFLNNINHNAAIKDSLFGMKMLSLHNGIKNHEMKLKEDKSTISLIPGIINTLELAMVSYLIFKHAI